MKPLQDRVTPARILYSAIFFVALFIRLFFLNDFGSYDMSAFIEWGEMANEQGLGKAYAGMGFPFQWLSFQISTAVAAAVGFAPHTILKITNLLFELGTFSLLIAILRHHKKTPAYALLFWAHPYFIIISVLGYAGVQYSFMIVLMVYLSLDTQRFSRYCWAGIPLGVAFLMKPQALIIILATGFYIVFSALRHKNWKPLALTIAPIVLFSAWSLYFSLFGASITTLAETYLRTPNVQPAICAQMLTPWYSMAYLLTEPGRAVVSESDLQPLFGPFDIRPIAFYLTVAYLAVYVIRFTKHSSESDSNRPPLWLLWGYAALILPMLMTSAHENHAYLASIFLVLLSTLRPGRISNVIAIQIFMGLQCLNLLGLYGVGMNAYTETYFAPAMHYFTPEVSLIGSLISSACFLLILGNYYQQLTTPEKHPDSTISQHPFLPSALLIVLFPILYALALYTHS